MKYALITGAGGGLGGAGAQALAEAGWMVFAADVRPGSSQNSRIVPLVVDVTSDTSVRAAVELIGQTTDRLDAVINFAGVHAMGSFVEGDIAAMMDKLIDVNLMGMVRVNRAFFAMLRAGGGRVINCSSECGYMKAQPFNGPYTVSKYAVEAYSDSLRRELLSQGIKVIKVQPGSFKTGLLVDSQASFEQLYDNTLIYKRVLTKMKPLMDREFREANDPDQVGKVLLRAVSAKHPKIRYRVKNSKLLGLMELIPDGLLDAIYRAFMR